MTDKIYSAIIVGGGIAGLACAKHLSDHGFQDFLLISKDIGGRIKPSADGKVNYGAYYVRSDYRNVRRFVRLKRRIPFERIRILGKGFEFQKVYWSLLGHPYKFLKLVAIVFHFNRYYKKFRIRSQIVSQKQAIEEDKYLLRLYKEKAETFLEQNNLQIFSNIIDALARFNGFVNLKDVSAFDLLAGGLAVLYPAYEYEMSLQKLTKPFKDRILVDEALSVFSDGEHWTIKNKSAEYFAKIVVMATPATVTSELLGKKLVLNNKIKAFTFHVSGSLHSRYVIGNFLVMPQGNEIAIIKQQDKTYVFYSLTEKPDFEKYFNDYKVIYKQFWNPALFLGTNLLDANLDKNLLQIGDNNIGGLEDSYITGIYAANQIINN